MKMKWKVGLEGLDCAHCAGKIEEDVSKLAGIKSATVNLLKQEMTLEIIGTQEAVLKSNITGIVKKHEPDVSVRFDEDNDSQADEEKDEFKKELNKRIMLYGIGIFLFLCASFVTVADSIETGLYLVSYLIFGLDVLVRAAKNITKGQVFDENFLMSIATLGAIAIKELPEAVFVMLFYQIGETFQDLAVNRSRKSIRDLMEIRADFASVIEGEEVALKKSELVKVGDKILVKPGERIPLDAIVTEGEAFMDTSMLTGESVPRRVRKGDQVLSGSINTNGVLKLEVIKEFSESTATKIIELVENAGNKKSKTERFITRFARIYTPIVVIIAVLLSLLPPIFGLGAFSMWFGRALIFLVISCPCALVLSVPLGFFSGIGEASRNGILVKGSNYMQVLSEVDTVVFDKTGTLTKGVFEVTKVYVADGFTEQEIIKWAGAAEKMSNHPIAKSILAYAEENGTEINEADITSYEEKSGRGITAIYARESIVAGNLKLMNEAGIDALSYDGIGSVVYVGVGGKFAGYLVVSDVIKSGAKDAIEKLKGIGVKRVILLTGDNRATAEALQAELKIDECYSDLLPQHKVEKMEEILGRKTSGKAAFIGDGINDAPVLARADVGIAMGGVGSDAAIEAADVVIMNDELIKIADGIVIARGTNRIVLQNIIFALGVKFIVLILGAIGFASMWMAVFADVGVTFLAILNSLRKKDKIKR